VWIPSVTHSNCDSAYGDITLAICRCDYLAKHKDERVGHREARITVLGWINIRKPKGAMPILCCTS